MPTRGDSYTAPDGKTYKFTEGGKWREYVNGKATNNLLPGSTFNPGAAPATSAAPTQISPEHQIELDKAKRALQNQVGVGGIEQWQADAQYEKLKQMSYNALAEANRAAGTASGAPGAPQVSAGFGQQALTGEAPYKTPTDITNVQDALNQRYMSQQQALNRPSEINPFGGSTYLQNPDGTISRVSSIGNLDPRVTANWTGDQYARQSYIDRALQAIAGEGGENNQGMGGLLPQLRGMFSKSLDYSGFSPIPTSDQFGAERKRVEDQLYQRFADVNEPLFQKQSQDLQQSFVNRGIDPTGERAKLEIEQMNRAQNDARQAARTQAMGMGGQEQQRLFENSLTSRGQQIGEAQQLRAQPLTDLRGLLSTVNPVQMPSFNQTANVDIPLPNFAGISDNFLNRQNQLKAAELGASTQMGIAELQANAAAEAQKQDFQNQQALNQQQFGFQQQLQNQNKPSFGDYAAGFFGPIIGAGVGNWLFGNNSGGSGGGFFSNFFR